MNIGIFLLVIINDVVLVPIHKVTRMGRSHDNTYVQVLLHTALVIC